YVIQIVLLSALIIVVVVLLVSLLRLRRTDYSALSNRMATKTRRSLYVMKPCPVCGTLLNAGERVHTIVFSGESPGVRKRNRESPTESMVHMFGCPHCYPPSSRHPRICPVCKGEISEEGYIVARMFVKGTRKHVHVLGCTECRGVARSGRGAGNSG
ncbi:MAG: hypothetical protein MI724_15860, partial [Spirochaetales bacterium]|nr:hypothetical protein [Spirochaetales bacterium]